MKKRKGFTLIELLIVIAIIGILASVILISLNSARKKAQDAQVKSDMSSLASALQIELVDRPLDVLAWGSIVDDTTTTTTDYNINRWTNPVPTAVNATGGPAGSDRLVPTIPTNPVGAINTNPVDHGYIISTPASGQGFAIVGKLNNSMYWCVNSGGSGNAKAYSALEGTGGAKVSCIAGL